MDDVDVVYNNLLDYLVTLDFIEVSWDENGNDYYRLTNLGLTANSMLNVFTEKDDDRYQVC
jgi:DNA-binding PadR family transcriptional regulator